VCTANLRPTDSIGDEERALSQVLREVQLDIKVGALTADGDSKAQKALDTGVEVLRDTRHFGQSLKKQIERAPFSDQVTKYPRPHKA